MNSVWKVRPGSYGTMLFRDYILREYVKGAFGSSGDVAIKRGVKGESLIFQATRGAASQLAPQGLHIQVVSPKLAAYSPSMLTRLVGAKISRGMWFKTALGRVVRHYKAGNVVYHFPGISQMLILWLWGRYPLELLQRVGAQFNGLRIDLKGRLAVKGKKRARSRSFSSHCGSLARTNISQPTELRRATINSRLGVVGLKLTQR